MTDVMSCQSRLRSSAMADGVLWVSVGAVEIQDAAAPAALAITVKHADPASFLLCYILCKS